MLVLLGNPPIVTADGHFIFYVKNKAFDEAYNWFFWEMENPSFKHTGKVVISTDDEKSYFEAWLKDGKLHNLKSAATIGKFPMLGKLHNYYIDGKYLTPIKDFPSYLLTNHNCCILDSVKDKAFEGLVWYKVLTKNKLYEAVPNISDFWEELPPVDP